MSKQDAGKSESGSMYQPAVALEFFRSAGKPEAVAQGATIFAENEKGSRLLLKRDKMYLLLEGEVALMAKNKPIGTVRIGEIFGEMASISQTPRSATALAKTPCRVLALDDKQFQTALQKKPEFALMMMSVIIGRLRDTIGRLGAAGALSSEAKWKDSTVFERKLLAELKRELGDETVRYDSGKTIMSEGQAGVFMYVVLEGRVAVSIKGSVVEKIGPGGVFGEMALLERAPRMASAVAETDCSLLAINRNVFLDLIKSKPEFGFSLLSAVGERARFMTSRQK